MNSTPASSAATRHIIVTIALVALAAIIWSVADAVVIAFGGIVMGSVLLSLSLPLARVTGLAPKWTLPIVIIGLLVSAGLLSWLFGSEVAKEFTELRRQLPQAAGKFQDWFRETSIGQVALDAFDEAGASTEALSRASAVAAGLVGATGNLLLILFLSIYFAADPGLYRDGAVRLVPPRRRPQVRRALDDAGIALRKWVVAQAIAMVAVGVLTGTVLGIMGVPLALSLGVLAGLLEFVPVVGPIVAAIPGILLAFLVGPQMALYVTIVYVVVQQIESNVITPLVQRWAVRLPPVVALLAIVVAGLLFGILGVVFAIPIAVIAMVFIKDLYIEDTLEKKPRTE